MFPKSKRFEDREYLDTFKDRRCIACNNYGCDPCHIRSFGSGGGDEFENVMALCREHHTEQHKIGWLVMSKKYPAILDDLKEKGWKFNDWGKLIR